MTVLSKLTVGFMAIAGVVSHCPNACSGHGKCVSQDRCECHQNWQGPDCSERTCPFELEWVGTAASSERTHNYAECSNKGVCDRDTGLCECFDGYEGKGCQRSACPNSCSGHGTCEYIDELANDSEDRRVGGVDGLIFKETDWDWQKIQGCKCDIFYEGSDCSARMCPMGDDPLTAISMHIHEKQRIAIYQAPFDASQAFTEASGVLTAADDNAAGIFNSAAVDRAYYSVGDTVVFKGTDIVYKVGAITTNKPVLDAFASASITSKAYRVKTRLTDVDPSSLTLGVKVDSTTFDVAPPSKGSTVTITEASGIGDLHNDALQAGVIISFGSNSREYVIQNSVAGSGDATDVQLDKDVVISGAGDANDVVYEIGSANPTGEFFLTYYDAYGGAWNTTTIPISSTAGNTDAARTTDANAIQNALRALPMRVLDDVVVTADTAGPNEGLWEDGTAKFTPRASYNFVVTFVGTVGTSGRQFLLDFNGLPTAQGSFPVSGGLFKDRDGGTATNVAGFAKGLVTREGTPNFKSTDRSELSVCSNRGVCDGTSGVCECFSGYRGVACEFQEALV